MTLQDLIDFHATGAAACEAFAVTPAAGDAKYKDITKHYTKRAKWHRDAVALLSAQHQGEPVALQHIAVAEDGKLRWMTGRKMQDCELYAMPDGSAIRSKLYAEQSAPVAVVMPEILHQTIRDTLRNYRMSTLDDGHGGGYPLIDAMTADGQPVSGGIEECQYLADAILNACIDEVARLNGAKP